MLQPNVFQEFQPIGGVAPTRFSGSGAVPPPLPAALLPAALAIPAAPVVWAMPAAPAAPEGRDPAAAPASSAARNASVVAGGGCGADVLRTHL
jgi:hypothetical protein